MTDYRFGKSPRPFECLILIQALTCVEFKPAGRVPTNPGVRRDPAAIDGRRRSGRRVRKMACRLTTNPCPVLTCAAACLAPEARRPVRAATAYGGNK